MTKKVAVYLGEELAAYGFGEGHPFGPDRHDAFVAEFEKRGLPEHPGLQIKAPIQSSGEELKLFHTPEYIEKVRSMSKLGVGYLDQGDTPAMKGIYEPAMTVVATVVDAVDQIMAGHFKRAFIPIAGLHHARRDSASGFCVFNDCGVAIEVLRQRYNIRKVAYVDIDAHHGDGVFYSYADDPDLVFVDLHEDGQYLYPGTGAAHETGLGEAKGTKLNIPMAPGADDEAFLAAWPKAQAFLEKMKPEFIILQCGADSLAGDPITHMQYSEQSHAYCAKRLVKIADVFAESRLLALGGGGYNRSNLANAWSSVVAALLDG